MNNSYSLKTVVITLLLLVSSLAVAQGQAQESVYGSQLMTEQERMEYRSKMRAAKTQEERKQIRWEHHQRMQERAKAQGVELPDIPPAQGGKGMGQGKGMSQGKGMGKGGS